MSDATAVPATDGVNVAAPEVVTAYVDALNAHDADAVIACVADDFRSSYAGVTGREFTGRDEYRRRLPNFFAEFPGLRYDPDAVIADGDRAAVPYTMSATWMDRAQQGHPFRLRGVFVFRLRDGRIAERTDFWDSGEFTRQTGG